jgi:hypothetical protein
MKKKIILLAFTALFAGALANEAMAQPGQEVQTTVGAPALTVDKTEHNFGSMVKGADASCVFVVKNTGDQPLQIINCVGSCGCTVPKWDNAPIPAGGVSEIKVQYDSNRLGAFKKSVTITWNSPDPNNAAQVVYISGEVHE